MYTAAYIIDYLYARLVLSPRLFSNGKIFTIATAKVESMASIYYS